MVGALLSQAFIILFFYPAVLLSPSFLLQSRFWTTILSAKEDGTIVIPFLSSSRRGAAEEGISSMLREPCLLGSFHV